MSRVMTHMTMSLDGFIAQDDDGIGSLFQWYDAGPTEVATSNPGIKFHLDDEAASMMRELMASAGALNQWPPAVRHQPRAGVIDTPSARRWWW